MRFIPHPRRFRRQGWIILATVLLAVILAGSAVAAIASLPAQAQPHYQSAVGTPVYLPTPTPTPKGAGPGTLLPPSPISGPASKGVPPNLPANTGVVYADDGAIYLLTSTAATPKKLTTPGYTSLVPPLLTNDGHLLYVADSGIFLIDPLASDTTPSLQIASIDSQKQVIASMAISTDGQQVFWTVEPHNGSGTIYLYTATLTSVGASLPTLLYSQPTNQCPCYMLFGLAGTGADGATTLLLTDNLGTPADQGTGLWTFDQGQQQIGTELLDEDQGEAPLALSSDHTLLAFAPTTGEIPEPTDNSIPAQIGSQPYGNSMAVVGTNSAGSSNPTTIVSPQANIHSFSSYHWITTPVFSADNQSLAYIQFSSDDVGPYDRHSTLYVAPTNGSGAPVVVASFTAHLVELGSWLDSHTILLYADNGIYAMDTQTAAIALLTVVPNYSRILGLIPIPG